MALKKTNLSLVEVKQNIMKESAISGKRTEKNLSDEERKLFCKLFPMTDNDILAKQFLISTEDIERLAHELHVFKDPAFTRNKQLAKSGAKPEMGTTPSRLISAVTKKWTEEERREILIMREEGFDPIEMLRELASMQKARVINGAEIENDRNEMWRVQNDAIDSYRETLVKIYELENGQEINVSHSFEDLILESTKRKP
jgi:hypothetical protein